MILFAMLVLSADFKATCPVSGAAAKEDVKVTADGKSTYFCCDSCKGKFEADGKKFTAKANAQLVETKQFKQKACPLSGGPIAEGTAAKVGKCEVEVSFCCANCQGKVKGAKGDKQVELVFGEKAFKKGFEAAK